MNVLVLNAGSTSLKCGLFDGSGEVSVSVHLDWADGRREQAMRSIRKAGHPVQRCRVAVLDDFAAVGCALDAVREAAGLGGQPAADIGAIGHRVVHGGAEFRRATLVDAEVKAVIERFGTLAPLHNPPALRGIEALERALPGVPQVAVFDTAFFAALPPRAYRYPVPEAWYRKWGIRRFGFHGLSHAWCARRGPELLPNRAGPLRMISCHLGGGCSAAAIRGGEAVATTMGFSPLEGLMMATRSGSIDPGILLHLLREPGVDVATLERDLNQASGLLGISGVSSDWVAVEQARADGHPRASLAWDLFVDRARGAIGSLVTALGGLDALVFTDRIGEGSPALRAAVCENLEFLGVRLDPVRNQSALADVDIAQDDSAVRVLVLHTEEEWMVAREARPWAEAGKGGGR